MIENSKEFNDLNEIIEVRYGDGIYNIWKVEFIRPKITKFLKEIYPDSIIARELNKIDSVLFDNKSKFIVPIEIQKTPIQTNINGNKSFAHTEFEKSIRTQISINIETYEKCWLFFDSEYLRYLQSGNVGKSISVDLTWIIELMRENTLKVFVIRYDGIVKELTTKDFDFLKELSQICKISYDSDNRLLNRNKLEIYYNVVRGYKFTQEEITQFESEFDNRNDKKENDSVNFYIQSNNERCKLYGNILTSIRQLPIINKVLSCVIEDKKIIHNGVILGLFEQNNYSGHSNYATIQFIDKFNVAQYFPGYIKNKEMWDYCKNKKRIFSMNEFRGIIEGTFNYEFIKKQSTMLDY